MDYEKEYKEALDRAKKAIIRCRPLSPEANLAVSYALSYVFPTTAESEDERIKNDIMEAVENWLPYERVEEIRAYLEKQKEQKPVDIKIDNPNVQKFDTDVKVTTSDSSAGGKELLYVCNKSYDIGFRDGVASVKPAEWSEEDESKKERLISIVKRALHGNKCPILNDDGATELITWLKSLRPQPKQDVSPSLSEKEIICLKRILDHLRKEHNRYDGEDFTNEIVVLEWLITHPVSAQPHWKPSEEQMSMLLSILNEPNNASSESARLMLESLYNDLKAL